MSRAALAEEANPRSNALRFRSNGFTDWSFAPTPPRYTLPRARLRTRGQAMSAATSLSATPISTPPIITSFQMFYPEVIGTASMAVDAGTVTPPNTKTVTGAATIAATTATDTPRMMAFHSRSKPMSRMTTSAAITTDT